MESPDLLKDELSSSTLAALQEFLSEQQKPPSGDPEEDVFAENWGMSQFWYSQETARKVAEEVFELSENGRLPIACVACPSLFREMKAMYPGANTKLLEFDRRFQVFGDRFCFYDYNEPENLPAELHNTFHVVVADPPYLSEECIAKTSLTVKFLAQTERSPLLLLTGAVQRNHALTYLGMRPCRFRPQHKNKLGNEFALFTNYEPSQKLGGWMEDV